MIHEGSIVQCNWDFTEERKTYPYNYPDKKQFLTVSQIVRDSDNNRLLFFLDWNIPIPLLEACFDELQSEAEGDEILNEAWKIANNL